MSEKTKIELKVSAKWYKDMPKYRFLVNDTLVSEGELAEKQADNQHKILIFDDYLEPSENTIRLQFLNKQYNDTVVDSNGTIIADTGIIIESLTIDDIDMGDLLYMYGNFYPDKHVRPDLPDVLTNHTYCPFTGEWQFKFDSPVYIWLLENL